MSRRALALAAGLAAATGVLLGAAPAWSYWSAAAAGSASAKAAVLARPPAPAASAASATSVTVTGTLPAGQLGGTTYDVVRGGATVVCSPITSPFTCTDPGLSPATAYSYTVVAKLAAWRAASPARSVTTRCAAPDTFVVSAPATVVAGTAFTVRLTARTCAGATDTAYTGTKSVTFPGLPTSPSGRPPLVPVQTTFTAGTASASITVYAAGATTLRATEGSVTGAATLRIGAADPAALAFVGAANPNGPVTVACTDGPDLSADRLCLQTSTPATGTSRTWSASVQLLDPWGNVAPNTTGQSLTVSLSTSGGSLAPTAVAVAQGSSRSGAFTASLPDGVAPVTITAWETSQSIRVQVTGAG